MHDWHPGGADRMGKTGNIDVSPASLDQFHTYSALLEADKVTVFFDGKPVWSSPMPNSWPDDHFFVLLNMCVGGGWPIQCDAFEFPIDYVRVYSA